MGCLAAMSPSWKLSLPRLRLYLVARPGSGTELAGYLEEARRLLATCPAPEADTHVLLRMSADFEGLRCLPVEEIDERTGGRADAALAGRDLCPPCSMGFRVAATIALARAGDLQQTRARLEAAERIAGMWQGGP
jgi:hypothetical protein